MRNISLDEALRLPVGQRDHLDIRQKSNHEGPLILSGFKRCRVILGGEISGDITVIDSRLEQIILDGLMVHGSFSIRERCDVDHFIINEVILSDHLYLMGLSFPLNSSISISSLKAESIGLTLGTHFQAEISIYNLEVQKPLDIIRVQFKNRLDLGGSSFQFPVLFEDCGFERKVRFENLIFSENLLLEECSFEESFEMDSLSFKKGINISSSLFKSGLVSRGVELSFFKVDLDNDFLEFGRDITPTDRISTYRKLKGFALENQNYTEYSLYRSLEYRNRISDLTSLIFKNGGVSLWKKANYFQDLIVHLLNWSSNGFGTSPGRALLFTLICTLIGFYGVAEAGTSGGPLQSFNIMWEHPEVFLKMLNPVHRLNIYEVISGEITDRFWVVFWDLFCRIFVGYGYYQFVQAFRRFK